MIDQATLEAFRYWRRKLGAVSGLVPFEGAAATLARARAEVAEGKPRRFTGAPVTGPRFAYQSGGESRFFESADAFPGRLIGFADEVAEAAGSRRVENQGWYNRFEDYDSTLRGIVFQLPAAANGSTRFVGGYQETEFGGIVVDPSTVYTGERGGSDRATDDGAALEAAAGADSMAEHAAEESRDYDEAWQAGAHWNDLGEEVAEARKAALAILRERKALAGVEAPAARGAICDRLAQYLESIRDARDKREELVNSIYHPPFFAAFLEGAGLPQSSRLFADSARDWRPA